MTHSKPFGGTYHSVPSDVTQLYWGTSYRSVNFSTALCHTDESLPKLTCRPAILLVFSSCTFLRLFTARSIGCHVNQDLVGQAV